MVTVIRYSLVQSDHIKYVKFTVFWFVTFWLYLGHIIIYQLNIQFEKKLTSYTYN